MSKRKTLNITAKIFDISQLLTTQWSVSELEGSCNTKSYIYDGTAVKISDKRYMYS